MNIDQAARNAQQLGLRGSRNEPWDSEVLGCMRGHRTSKPFLRRSALRGRKLRAQALEAVNRTRAAVFPTRE